jgi:hypothetical protein
MLSRLRFQDAPDRRFRKSPIVTGNADHRAWYPPLGGSEESPPVRREREMNLTTILIIVVVVMLLGGGGLYWRGRG